MNIEKSQCDTCGSSEDIEKCDDCFELTCLGCQYDHECSEPYKCPKCLKPNDTELRWPCKACTDADPVWLLASRMFEEGCGRECGAGFDPNDFCCLKEPDEAYRLAEFALESANKKGFIDYQKGLEEGRKQALIDARAYLRDELGLGDITLDI